MVTFVNGKPGDGKSLYAVSKILELLVEGDAYVVTNIPLKAPEICEHVAKERERKKDDRPFVFDDEVRVLKDEETYEFYRRRAGGLVLAQSPDFDCEVRERLDRPEFIAKMKAEFMRIKEAGGDALRPVWYFIDEAHNYFSAREWANAGRGLLYYVSQHRHLHDQIFFITQVTENVEKQLRGLASELHRIRNQLRRSIGPFRMRPCFKVQKFYGVPADGAQATPFNVETMFLNPAGVAGCYHTVGALGVQSKPEKIKNAGKLPYWSLWLAGLGGVALIAAAFVMLPWLAGKGSAKLLLSAAETAPVKAATASIDAAAGNSLNKDAQPGSARDNSPSEKSRSRNRVNETEKEPLWVTGVAFGRNQVNVSLSDGRVLSEGDGVLAKVERNYVDLTDGQRIYRRQGSGAKGAPVRQDTEVPVVAVPAATGRNPTAAIQSAGPAAGPSVSDTAPSTEGSWVTDKYGISRLREKPTLATSLGR